MKALTYIEIDLPSFVEASPEEIVTYRFTYDCGYQPSDIEAIPSLAACEFAPATISLGKDLGTRADLRVTFKDHKHVFNGEPFTSGTFFGKWRARYGTRLQGRPLRWIQGLLGQTLEEMETRHFIIDATEGPTPQANYSLRAKDILKLADGDKSLAPFPSNGFLIAGITDSDVSLTLAPTGIGDAEYPSSGFVAIAGEESVSFTRVGDVMTIVRAQLGSVAVDHDAGARVQLVLRYVGQDPADIIYDLLTTYVGIDPDYIPLATWQSETDTYLQQQYTANIAEPTEVDTLISEIIEQAALVVWWEPLTQLIRLQVLRAISTGAATYGERDMLEGSLSIREQPTTRLSQVLTYFGQRNPLNPIDQENNFRSSALTIDGEAETAYGQPAIKKVFSRWIPFGARTVALRLNDLLLGRFRDPPRRFAFNLFRYNNAVNPELGAGYQVEAFPLQTVTGEQAQVPIQVTRLKPLSDRYEIEAEEMLFQSLDPADLVNRVITIDSNIFNLNLRELHDTIYPDPDVNASPAESVRFIIEDNAIVGSASHEVASIIVGDWPLGYPVTIEVRGRIQGAGGPGGRGSAASGDIVAEDGEPGGTALYTRFAVDVEIIGDGGIWGGGGGGAGLNRSDDDPLNGWGGGGGAGYQGGAPGQSSLTESENNGTAPTAGTTEAGGAAGGPAQSGFFEFSSGAGGAPGAAGGNSVSFDSTSGGAAGHAVDGISFVTLSDTSPTGIRGGTVN